MKMPKILFLFLSCALLTSCGIKGGLYKENRNASSLGSNQKADKVTYMNRFISGLLRSISLRSQL